MEIQFQNLELIPQLLKKVCHLEETISKLMPPITTKKEVAKFLSVTPRTVNNYISQGLLVEGVHFYRKGVRMLVFIEDAIFDFSDKLKKGIIKDEKITV